MVCAHEPSDAFHGGPAGAVGHAVAVGVRAAGAVGPRLHRFLQGTASCQRVSPAEGAVGHSPARVDGQGELMEVAFPLFVRCYLQDIDNAVSAAKFFDLYRLDHEVRHRTDLEELAAVRDKGAEKDSPVGGASRATPPPPFRRHARACTGPDALQQDQVPRVPVTCWKRDAPVLPVVAQAQRAVRFLVSVRARAGGGHGRSCVRRQPRVGRGVGSAVCPPSPHNVLPRTPHTPGACAGSWLTRSP